MEKNKRQEKPNLLQFILPSEEQGTNSLNILSNERNLKPCQEGNPWEKTRVKKKIVTLAGVAEWTECRPTNQSVTGLIPSQGTCLGCRPGPQLRVCERQTHTDVSLPLFPSL